MKLNYLVEVNLADLDFKGPKVKHFAENFYKSDEYKCFEEKVNNTLEKDLKSIFTQEKIKHIYTDLESDDTKNGAYTFTASFYVEGYVDVSFKNNKFKLSRNNINKLEIAIKELIYSKIEDLQKIYPEVYHNIYLDDIDIVTWEEVD